MARAVPSRASARRLIVAALALFACVAFATPARAQSTSHHPYRLRWDVDPGMIAAASMTWGGTELYLSSLVTPSCPCSPSTVPPIDRPFAGHLDQGIARASDYAVFSVIALSVVGDAIEVFASHREWSEALEDAVIVAEAVLISGAVNQVVKLGVHRPRPFVYGLAAGDPLLREPDSYLSFYSAHTSSAFAATLAYAFTFAIRHPHSRMRAPLFALAGLTGVGIGMLRVAAGKHFPTDVLVGGLAGTISGLLVPYLHMRHIPITPIAAVMPDGMYAGVGLVF